MNGHEPEKEDLLAEAYWLGLTGGFRMAFEYALVATMVLYLITAVIPLNDPYGQPSFREYVQYLLFLPLLYLLYGYWILILLFPLGSSLLDVLTATLIALPLRGSRPWGREPMRALLLVMTLVVIAALALAAYALRPAPWALIIFFILPGLLYPILARRLLRAIRALAEGAAPTAPSITHD